MAQSHPNRVEGHLHRLEVQRSVPKHAPSVIVHGPERWETLVAAATSSEPRMVALRPDIESKVLEHFAEMTEQQQARLMADPHWEAIIRRSYRERDVPLQFDPSLLQRVKGTMMGLYRRFRQEYLRWSMPRDVRGILSTQEVRIILWHFDASLLEEQRMRGGILTAEDRVRILNETLKTLYPRLMLDEGRALTLRLYFLERLGMIREN